MTDQQFIIHFFIQFKSTKKQNTHTQLCVVCAPFNLKRFSIEIITFLFTLNFGINSIGMMIHINETYFLETFELDEEDRREKEKKYEIFLLR